MIVSAAGGEDFIPAGRKDADRLVNRYRTNCLTKSAPRPTF